MALSSAFPLRSLRVLVVAIALVFTTIVLMVSQASADTPDPADGQIDETDRALALIALTDGGSTAIIDETHRGNALIALTSSPTSPYINGRGQVAYAETEHALALNAQALQTELAPQSSSPNTPY